MVLALSNMYILLDNKYYYLRREVFIRSDKMFRIREYSLFTSKTSEIVGFLGKTLFQKNIQFDPINISFMLYIFLL